MKHQIYHGLYKNRKEVEMDAGEYLPAEKRAQIEFAHKQNVWHNIDGRKVYVETFIVIYAMDKRFYSLNGQRAIIDRDAQPWKIEQKANIDPNRQLARMPDYRAEVGENRMNLWVFTILYERLAALERFWAGELDEASIPIVVDRLTGMGVESAKEN